jgi:hypothetical protein
VFAYNVTRQLQAAEHIFLYRTVGNRHLQRDKSFIHAGFRNVAKLTDSAEKLGA